MKDMICRCAYLQEILIQFFPASYVLFELRNLAKMKCIFSGNSDSDFFLGVSNLKILPKWNILLKQFVCAIPLYLLNRISWNCLVAYKGHTLYKCTYAGNWIWLNFFPGVTPLLNLEKFNTETVCHSSKRLNRICCSW